MTTSSGKRKPRISLAIATAFGLGYLPKAPGTFGALAGVAITLLPHICDQFIFTFIQASDNFNGLESMNLHIGLTILIAILGVFTADRAARFWGQKDPQRVVIDEVSGQYLTYLLGIIQVHRGLVANGYPSLAPVRFPFFHGINWNYFLAGFILFRAFDIWKPFPARQAESLPGGLGIMADDWIAGIYAGFGLLVVRIVSIRFGLHLGF
jgi:phosphatidylglycerophosphatase A